MLDIDLLLLLLGVMTAESEKRAHKTIPDMIFTHMTTASMPYIAGSSENERAVCVLVCAFSITIKLEFLSLLLDSSDE